MIKHRTIIFDCFDTSESSVGTDKPYNSPKEEETGFRSGTFDISCYEEKVSGCTENEQHWMTRESNASPSKQFPYEGLFFQENFAINKKRARIRKMFNLFKFHFSKIPHRDNQIEGVILLSVNSIKRR